MVGKPDEPPVRIPLLTGNAPDSSLACGVHDVTLRWTLPISSALSAFDSVEEPNKGNKVSGDLFWVHTVLVVHLKC